MVPIKALVVLIAFEITYAYHHPIYERGKSKTGSLQKKGK